MEMLTCGKIGKSAQLCPTDDVESTREQKY